MYNSFKKGYFSFLMVFSLGKISQKYIDDVFVDKK